MPSSRRPGSTGGARRWPAEAGKHPLPLFLQPLLDPAADRLGSRASQGLHLLGFALTEDSDLLGLGLRESLNLRRLLLGAGVVRLALVGLDRDVQLRLRERGLLLGPCLSLAQLALLDRGFLLPVVGFHLLLGDLARAELRQDLLDLAAALARR